jgi:hypothetical protein
VGMRFLPAGGRIDVLAALFHLLIQFAGAKKITTPRSTDHASLNESFPHSHGRVGGAGGRAASSQF